MSRKSITFYKLQSPYPEDVNKNGCGLVGQEIDRNFMNLKEMDIELAYREGQQIILQRVDGEKLCVDLEPILKNVTTDFCVSYDKQSGYIVINYNGNQAVIDGLITTSNIDKTAMKEVISDSSLYGKGNIQKPLKISPVYTTGMYSPVKRLIDITTDDSCGLPSDCKNIKGDRYIVREKSNEFGYLYDHESAKRINSDLACEGHGWRIPTKNDWDGMLNAIEPCDEYRNHNSISGNIQCGKYACKLLKSKKYWKVSSFISGNCDYNHMCNCDCNCDCDCHQPSICPQPKPVNPEGVDAFGMSLLPSGYGDGCQLNGYFSERAMYWTNSVSHVSDVYVKRFDYDKATVVQEIVSPRTIASIRLVKDYDGTNHIDTENILGKDYGTVLLPSTTASKGYSIWTTMNFAASDCRYCPVEPNGGLGLPIESYYPKYYIVEWDGFKWLRKEMKEGESVVLLEGLNGEKNIEYRIVSGELVNVTDFVYDLVINNVQPQLDNLQEQINNNRTAIGQNAKEIYSIKQQLTDTNNRLAQEIADRQQGDTILNNKIDDLNSSMVEANERLKQAIEQEKQERVTQDNLLWSALNNETNERQNADNILTDSINHEIKRATEAESNLQIAIDNEVKRATSEEEAIKSSVETERNERIESDRKLYSLHQKDIEFIKEYIDEVVADNQEITKELQEQIQQERIERTDSDKVLTDAINGETYRASEAEKALDARLEQERAERIDSDKVLTDAINGNTAELSSAIEAEKNRAEAVENEIKANLETEINERKEADEALRNDLNSEITRSTQEDEYIKGNLLQSSGHSYDLTNGVITLKRNNGEEITIEIDSDYGSF